MREYMVFFRIFWFQEIVELFWLLPVDRSKVRVEE